MAAPTADHLSLGQMRWPTLEEDRVLLLVPLGSLEQHGPHLPLGSDTIIATAVTREAARRLHGARRRALAAPAVGYGASGEHEGFPGTISIGHDALRLLLVEFARSACRWVEGLIYVNGHGGNVPTVASAVAQLREEGRAVAWTSCSVPGGDAHAGSTETSVLQFIAPWSVRTDLMAAGPTTPVAELLPELRAKGVRAVSPSGVLGDPTSSSVAEGKRIFADLVARVVEELTDLDVGADGRLRAGVPAGPGVRPR